MTRFHLSSHCSPKRRDNKGNGDANHTYLTWETDQKWSEEEVADSARVLTNFVQGNLIPAPEQNITSVRQKTLENRCRVPRQIIWPTLSCPSSLLQRLDQTSLLVDCIGCTRLSQYGRIRSQPFVVCAVITIPGSSSLRGTIYSGRTCNTLFSNPYEPESSHTLLQREGVESM